MSVSVDKTSRVPLYLQLMEKLIDKITQQEYLVDEQLPAERELCDIYSLSRITVRQALQELEREGYIYKLHGKGTFVASKSYNQKLVKLYSFTEEMHKIGKVPTTKVLSFKKISVDERLALKMGLEAYDDVYQVTRIRLADGEPLMYETSFIPDKIFPDLTERELIDKPMYEIFSDQYDIGVTRATESFRVTTIRREEAKHLQTVEDKPAMLVKRYAYHENSLIEYTVSVARGDKFNYTVELT